GRLALLDCADQFVDVGDRLVERQALDRLSHRGNGLVQLALERFVLTAAILAADGESPDALDEAGRTLNATFGPFEVALWWAVRQQEPASGVGSVALDDGVGVDDIAL